MAVVRFYRSPGLSQLHIDQLNLKLSCLDRKLKVDTTEFCFYAEFKDGKSLQVGSKDFEAFESLISTGPDQIRSTSSLFVEKPQGFVVLEIGPRLNFTTAYSTNAVSACRASGIQNISRLERSTIFRIVGCDALDEQFLKRIVDAISDRMTECVYDKPIVSFQQSQLSVKNFSEIDIMGGGMEVLKKANISCGLALDSWDLTHYYELFTKKLKRNPTDVELFDIAQSNSEHSRHWFFKGEMTVDGAVQSQSLFDMVMETQKFSNDNNVIKFSDNSSGIRGYPIDCLLATSSADKFIVENRHRHIIYTAETHNFPTGVCPFPGAATGTGGRIRDVQAAGRGGYVVAGVAAYSFGNLNIPGYKLPWEDSDFVYPHNMAKPLDVIIQASNGASDYGNKFGEPVICGFARSFGLNLPHLNERIEWIKPIMFSGGIGSIEDQFLHKFPPTKGLSVVKLGGPVYRIGVGGGAASSLEVQGHSDRDEELDFKAVQRGDPEMEQKLNRVIRACAESDNNPILSIHDQGAGGNGNVLKEIVEGAGAELFADAFELGDPTINVLELWGAEFQESNAILIDPSQQDRLKSICQRESCPISIVGTVTDTNKIVLHDFSNRHINGVANGIAVSQHPVDIDLDLVLGKMPQKKYNLDRKTIQHPPLEIPADMPIYELLHMVLQLPSVGSKRYLTNKVDRSVTGLIAQQQCVGPLHTPLANVGVTALSYFDIVGSAVAVGEQPIKGLVNPACGARMSVGESLMNLVFAPITELKDVKCSGNWMWPAKLSGEGVKLWDSCVAMCGLMKQLGVAIDGGKDSLSMAAHVGKDIVKSPGSLVISSYAPCVDVTKVVTPDLKVPDGKGILMYLRFGSSMDKHRLGGSSLAQCLKQLGDDPADLDRPDQFVAAFNATQQLIKSGLITAAHDVSDGGLLVCVLEMAFAGNCGIDFHLNDNKRSAVELCFAEELGIVAEIREKDVDVVSRTFVGAELPTMTVGYSNPIPKVKVAVNGEILIFKDTAEIRDVWERTSYELDKLQCNPQCVEEEHQVILEFPQSTVDPQAALAWATFSPIIIQPTEPIKVAILREQGSNGDREMAAAFHLAGFQPWDVCMNDLLSGQISLDQFRGIAFVGGFSYADVFGSAKGWASGIVHNAVLKSQFDRFYYRPDTFSFGVCNGCQLMAQLGWVGNFESSEIRRSAQFVENKSGRFESRFSWVKVGKSFSIMLNGMSGWTLGVWVSHGEGQLETAHFDKLNQANLIPLKYVDRQGQSTTRYPFNPNGSVGGAAGLSSVDGRHLAIMPHPERSFLTWQWAEWPQNWPKPKENHQAPWMKIFSNAYEWCCSSSD